jgi:hypothetical protein
VLAAVILGALAAPVTSAVAAPPANDAPTAPGVFSPYTAENGSPRQLQAVAEMAESTADAGVPRCLGPKSFARTVWYVIPADETPQELTVEASGRTLSVIDLAAYVQPSGANAPSTAEPNACSGIGAGGSDAAEEPTSGVMLRVPAGRAVLIQVGRRGPVGSAENERVVLSLDARSLALPFPPAGDIADPATTPAARVRTPTFVQLDGSTITGEDPAEPPCPSLGSAWRRFTVTRSGPRLVSVAGAYATTLSVFEGTRPTGDNALDCVNRAGRGQLQMLVPVRARRTVWVRIGSDAPRDAAEARLEVADGEGALVIDGGPGGFDPTTGGPGGGFPADCTKSNPALARVGGTPFRGRPKVFNRRRTIGLRLHIRGDVLCDVVLRLVGPRGRIYASGRAIRLKKGRPAVKLRRVRDLVSGSYSLRVSAVDLRGKRVKVRTALRGRLRK